MTRGEQLAFNAGVTTALDLARACGDALAPAAMHRVTRLGFAIGALDAFAEEGRALLIEASAEETAKAKPETPALLPPTRCQGGLQRGCPVSTGHGLPATPRA